MWLYFVKVNYNGMVDSLQSTIQMVINNLILKLGLKFDLLKILKKYSDSFLWHSILMVEKEDSNGYLK